MSIPHLWRIDTVFGFYGLSIIYEGYEDTFDHWFWGMSIIISVIALLAYFSILAIIPSNYDYYTHRLRDNSNPTVHTLYHSFYEIIFIEIISHVLGYLGINYLLIPYCYVPDHPILHATSWLTCIWGLVFLIPICIIGCCCKSCFTVQESDKIEPHK
jgi:hypothetical protein